ncbi:MAG: hypothetical protein ABI369_08340 [Acetobacteraceae bacterium]
MRWTILAAAATALAATPALANGPQCAMPGPVTMAATDPSPTIPLSAPASKPASSAAAAASTTPIVPSGLSDLPFARRVAAAGATLLDLGMSHGLHLAAARHGDEFRVFSILPSGDAAVEGAPIELSPTQLSRIASGTVTQLGRQAGFIGYFVRSGPSFQVFYATPDDQALVPGVLRDTQGRNITRSQVSNIPGAIPTVEVTGGGPQPRTAPTQRSAATIATLAAVEKATYGTIGPASAPQLFMLIDPQCIYSVRSYQQLRGYAQAGRIRLSIVPLSVLDYEDHGQSTRSALALLSKPADQIVPAWQAGNVAGPPSPNGTARLRQNMAIAEAIGVKGTPTFVWKKPDGTIGRIDGVPPDIGSLVASVGS